MEIHTEGIADDKRPDAERMLRATLLFDLKERADISFHHTDSLGQEARVSVPKLNGELGVSVAELLRQMGETLSTIANGQVVESTMRGTCNSWKRTPGR